LQSSAAPHTLAMPASHYLSASPSSTYLATPLSSSSPTGEEEEETSPLRWAGGILSHLPYLALPCCLMAKHTQQASVHTWHPHTFLSLLCGLHYTLFPFTNTVAHSSHSLYGTSIPLLSPHPSPSHTHLLHTYTCYPSLHCLLTFATLARRRREGERLCLALAHDCVHGGMAAVWRLAAHAFLPPCSLLPTPHHLPSLRLLLYSLTHLQPHTASPASCLSIPHALRGASLLHPRHSLLSASHSPDSCLLHPLPPSAHTFCLATARATARCARTLPAHTYHPSPPLTTAPLHCRQHASYAPTTTLYFHAHLRCAATLLGNALGGA